MSLHLLSRKSCVLPLSVAAVLAGSAFGGLVAAGASGHSTNSARQGQGNLPPILARATPSELAVIRQGEAEEAVASAYHLPASAEYSLAGLNGYAVTARK